MASVALVTAADHVWSHELRAELRTIAQRDRAREHTLVEDARVADVIVFIDAHQRLTDWSMKLLRRHPLVRRFPHKCFVYDERDVPIDALPGVYVSMPATAFDRRRHRAFGYYHLPNDTRGARNAEPDLLFSFSGRRVGAVRDAVLALRHPRAALDDTSPYDFFADRDARALEEARRRYREQLGRSKFVLSPRGAGTASFRLFEALAAGRVPVILSDDWVPPSGPRWDECSVRLPEAGVPRLVETLESLESKWPAMSDAARRTWDEWFAPDIWFHRLVEHSLELKAESAVGVRPGFWMDASVWRAGVRQAKAAMVSRKARSRR